MTQIQVERLTFTFEPTVDPFQYERAGRAVDGWPQDVKVVDVVAYVLPDPPDIVWLIEVKDFRVITRPPQPSNLAGLPDTVAAKVADTIQRGLPAVAERSGDEKAKAHAGNAIQTARWRVVLHLEPHPVGGPRSFLFPGGFQAQVLQKLRQLLAEIAPDPLVVDIARTPKAGVPWATA